MVPPPQWRDGPRPEDHIRWELTRPAPGGGAGEGPRLRIVEAFQRRPEFYVDSTETVEKLDKTGIRLVRRLAGVPIFQLGHLLPPLFAHQR